MAENQVMTNSASGNLQKMQVKYGKPVQYILELGDDLIDLNQLIGKPIKFSFNGQINCVSCGRKTKKSFNQGFCFQCMKTSPMADENIIRPELSMAQFGIARDMEWATLHDLIDHFVYLSLTSEVKVGVTRHHQIPTRWIDQGASQAIIIAKTPNRHIAGIIEAELKRNLPDKTNWKKMLSTTIENTKALTEQRVRIKDLLHPELQQYLLENEKVVNLTYPIENYPEKIVSLNFDKQTVINGILTGIKGQYLYFDGSKVINIRRHTGYFVNLEY